MRYNVRRWVASVVGAVLVGSSVVALSAPLGVLEPSAGVPMSLGHWQALRASQLEEDQDGWDCRVQGNATCGSVWWELVCPDAPQTPDLVCTLEPHQV